MTPAQYIVKLNTLYITGNAREHSYRGDLQNLLHEIIPDILVTNEPARVSCGAPDYVLTRKDVPVGYIEAKDIGVDLNGKNLKEQFDRYRAGLANLIFTDYLDFHFYKDAKLTTTVRIGEIQDGKIVALPGNFDRFTQLIRNFAETVTQTIKSPTKLAEMMAGKAKLMADVIERSLQDDDDNNTSSPLFAQMQSFRFMLIHDITAKSFADIYAQTIAYGMFAARYHDPTLPTFSRQEAATLIPKSNPFLRKLFQDIAGYDLDDRLVWIVDELVQIFLATDVADIMRNFGKTTRQEDPVVHFYETFLAAYSPALRKARGVWYTPQPVVSFIVRAVDDILKTEFGLKDGLADTSKIKIKKKVVTKATADRRSNLKEMETEVEVHKVQILDPATGTGTFLAEVVRHIHKKFEGQQGIWSKYVTNDLIPRLNGFELLMASYAMAHLKLDMLLTETGYKPVDDQRLRIFLTNSLEESHPDTGTLFSTWLADESTQANAIKRDAPVMVVMGNPPYSGISSNNGEWISRLIDDYKYVDGVHFNERKHWLNDDYVKFIRLGQYLIDKNGEGILAFINPHGFLDNPTFRGMRWNLLQSFDKIYTIDLHGNAKKKEVSPDGSTDQNVFDIMQGVSINIFIKSKAKKNTSMGQVFHYDLYGRREFKYDYLLKNNLRTLRFNSINLEKPYLFFVPKNDAGRSIYESGFQLTELFPVNVTGIVTARDGLVIDMSEDNLEKDIIKFTDFTLSDDDVRNYFFGGKKSGKYLAGDSRGWKLSDARVKIKDNKHSDIIKEISYRPFDTRFIYFSSNMVDWGRESIMHNFNRRSNPSIVVTRQSTDENWNNIQVTNHMIDNRFHFSYKGTASQFPLYIFQENENSPALPEFSNKLPNLNRKILKQFEKNLNFLYVPDEGITYELEGYSGYFHPIDVLDYIYAVLHSPSYREKYKEFLKIDFPRVPYPTDAETFVRLRDLGSALRQLHLLESSEVNKFITQYPEDGDNIVTKPVYKNGNVYINDTQYFKGVPESAWNFYIGGYQPAQKWLKDRKGRELSWEDILHYQKVVVALSETGRLMVEIDGVMAE